MLLAIDYGLAYFEIEWWKIRLPYPYDWHGHVFITKYEILW